MLTGFDNVYGQLTNSSWCTGGSMYQPQVDGMLRDVDEDFRLIGCSWVLMKMSGSRVVAGC